MSEEDLKKIEVSLRAALSDPSFFNRINTWLTAGDGREFCAVAPDYIEALLAEVRRLREVIIETAIASTKRR